MLICRAEGGISYLRFFIFSAMSSTDHTASRVLNGKYQNSTETVMDMSPGKMFSVAWRMLRGGVNREPKAPLPTVAFDTARFNADTDETLITWFGHSSLLVKFKNQNILFDPVFSPRASMFTFAGPKNFGYTNPMYTAALPRIDLVVLSHDHYDHLDKAVMRAIHPSVPQFYVPLGVKKRLTDWGVAPEKITESDWWQTHETPEFKLVCTPTRHFSGRGLFDRSGTLWCSWAFTAPDARFYFSGDSGYSPEFKKIGEAYGPFDFAFIECGQYNEDWENIHMMPEQSVQAALDVRTKLAMPIHWGKFALALHAWNDPVERFYKEAAAQKLPAFYPEIGHVYSEKELQPSDRRWWENL